MKRGEIWVGNMNPTRGHEIGKVRPVLIVQGDALTESDVGTVVVLPLTTQSRAKTSRYRVPVEARGKLHKDCYVVVTNPRTLDRRRIGEGPLTSLTAEEMARVERSLLVVLGMYR